MRHRRLLIGIVAYCSLGLGLTGDQHEGPDRPAGRQAWEWSLEERLALRLTPPPNDQSSIRDPDAPTHSGSGFVIDGRRTPEMFLPHELMSYLLTTHIDTANTEKIRANYARGLRDLQIAPEAFWRDVDAAIAPYLKLERSVTGERSAEVSTRLCAARADALYELRGKYRRLDEFLYRQVAADSVVAQVLPSSTEWLRWLEAGCR